MRQSGFTLLELSIVLVIIGLIIGGVTVGSELIKQAEMQGFIREAQNYDVVFNTFKLKYNTLPGDMKNASQYWIGIGFNGNGDGRIDYNTDFALAESYNAWLHLNRAGMHQDQTYWYPYSKRWDGIYFLPRYHGGLYNLPGSNAMQYGGERRFYAAEAQAVDAKTDDGLADKGKFVAYRDGADGCTSNISPNPSSYVLGNEERDCNIFVYWR